MRKRTTTAWFLILLLQWHSIVGLRAGLDDEMTEMFNNLVNVTDPSAYNGQRRGVISGGSIFVRNRISNPKLVAFEPPSFKAGCGGIDLYGGSFSFINSAQINQLMRDIAANAGSYAFGLALEGLCPTCFEQISTWLKKIEEMNKYLSNSCKAAQALVDSTGLRTWSEERRQASADEATKAGSASDSYQARSHDTKSPEELAADAAKLQEMTGNIVWDALKASTVDNWYTHGDAQLRRTLMSITGTIVVSIDPANTNALKYQSFPPILKIKDIVDGGSKPIYKCNDDENVCLDVQEDAASTIQSMRQKVFDLLFGDGTSIGIMAKLVERDGGSVYNAPEQAFMRAAPSGIVGMIHRLGTEPGAAITFAEHAVEVIALEMAASLINEMYHSVVMAIRATEKPLDTAMLQAMNDVRAQLDSEMSRAGQGLEQLRRMVDVYKTMRDTLLARADESRRQTAPNRPN